VAVYWRILVQDLIGIHGVVPEVKHYVPIDEWTHPLHASKANDL
jgi:hypothetical protein